MRLFLVAQPTACSLLAAAPAHDASFERDANEIPFSFQVSRPSVFPSVRRSGQRPRPSFLACIRRVRQFGYDANRFH